jgi:hypothetical protein
MIITIDTKHDSKDEIVHAISILNQILERQGYSAVSQSSSSAPSNTDPSNLMSMFSSAPETPKSADKGPDFSAFLNLAKQKEERKLDERDEFKMEVY